MCGIAGIIGGGGGEEYRKSIIISRMYKKNDRFPYS